MGNLSYYSSVYSHPACAGIKKVSPQKRKTTSQGLPNLPFTVGRLLQNTALQSSHTLLLGADAKIKPIFLVLSSRTVGSVLVTCGSGCGKTHQLQVMAESLLRCKSLNHGKVIIISTNPQEWASLNTNSLKKTNQSDVFSWYEHTAQELIGDLASLAEQRRAGQFAGPAIYLLLDELSSLEQLDWETQINLRWLLEYGPQSHIWPIATLDSANLSKIPFWVEPFSTFILGSGLDPSAKLTIPCRAVEKQLADLEPGECMTQLQGVWRSYRLPMLGD